MDRRAERIPVICECDGWCGAALLVPREIVDSHARRRTGQLVAADCVQWHAVDGLPADRVVAAGDGWALVADRAKGGAHV